MVTALTQDRPNEPALQYAACTVFRGLKLPNLESDHPPHTNAEIKDIWSCNTTPYYFMIYDLLTAIG
jgi:hypothetical protein